MKSICLVAVVCALAVTASAQRDAIPDPLVRAGVTVKLAEHSHVIPDGNVGAVPNVGIVVGSRGTLVIDPGLGRRNGQTVLREASRIRENAELYVASTHYHPEHTTGYVAFPPSARYVNSTVQEREFTELGMTMVKRFAGRSPMFEELLADAQRREAAITFDREHTLDLGGVGVRLLVVGPTHTRGDTVFFVEPDNVLFAGDVVMNQSFLAANDGSSMKAWLAAFDRLEALRPAVVVPAHGPVGDGSLIPAAREVMQAIQSRARQLKAEGHSAEETAAQIQREFQAKHPTWPRVNGVAAAARAAYNEAP